MRKYLVVVTAIVALITTAAPAASAGAAPSPPLPGGKYTGQTSAGAGERLIVKVRTRNNGARLRGVVRFPCAGIRARFRTDDGRFVARARRHRRTVFKARGRFEEMSLVRGSILRLRRVLRRGSCRPSHFGAALANAPRVHERTVSYGPFAVEPSMHAGHGGHNMALAGIEKPCEGCSLVGMIADLREADGRRANFDTGSMLHHVVLFNQDAADPTCPGWPQRFFASGNERTPFLLPRGYGYEVGSGDRWRLITHLMNMGEAAKDLTIQVTFYYVEGSSQLDRVEPFWVDINNCGNSQYETPAGAHTEARDFTVSAGYAGKVVAIGGHLHDYGKAIELDNLDSGDRLCRGRAGYGNDSSYMGHIDTVGGCIGRSLGRLRAGDTLRLLSRYDAPEVLPDVMGIMVGYVAPG